MFVGFLGFVGLWQLSSPHAKAFLPSEKQNRLLVFLSMNFDWLVIKRLHPLLAVSFTMVFFFNQKTETDVLIKQLSSCCNAFKTIKTRGAAWKEKINTAPAITIIQSLYFSITYHFKGGELKYLQDERNEVYSHIIMQDMSDNVSVNKHLDMTGNLIL